MKTLFTPPSHFLLRMDGKDHTIYTPHQCPFYVCFNNKGSVMTIEKRGPMVKPDQGDLSMWWATSDPTKFILVAEIGFAIKEADTVFEVNCIGDYVTVSAPAKMVELQCDIPMPLRLNTKLDGAWKPVLDCNHDPVHITSNMLPWDYLLKQGMLFRTREEAALAKHAIQSELIRLSKLQ